MPSCTHDEFFTRLPKYLPKHSAPLSGPSHRAGGAAPQHHYTGIAHSQELPISEATSKQNAPPPTCQGNPGDNRPLEGSLRAFTSHSPTGTRRAAAVLFPRTEQPQLPDAQTSSSSPSPTSPALLREGSPCSRHGCSKGEPPPELLQAQSNAEQGHGKASHPSANLGRRAALPSFLGSGPFKHGAPSVR